MTELKISTIGGAGEFLLEEAVALMNVHVVRKTDLSAVPTIEHLGYVAGIVNLNEEIEVLVKFIDELMQINKTRFSELLEIVADDNF